MNKYNLWPRRLQFSKSYTLRCVKKVSSVMFCSGAGCGAPPASPWGGTGRGAAPPGQAEREAEVLWGGVPARHGAVPVHRLPADRREERWGGAVGRSGVLHVVCIPALWWDSHSLKFSISCGLMPAEGEKRGKCWGVEGICISFTGECEAIRHSNELIPQSR